MNNFNKIIIAGMPNAGKSTVFNGLTGGNAKTGNWHGVTTSTLSKRAKIMGKEYTVYDLPGAYSLKPTTLEEKLAVKEVVSTNGIILYVIESVTLPSALKNVVNLLKNGKKVIVAVNMVNEFTKRGGKIDFAKLKTLLNCPVVYGEFNTRKGIQQIKNAIINYKPLLTPVSENLFNNLSLIYRAPTYAQGRLDALTLNAKTAVPIFFVLVFITFYLAFGSYGIGVLVSDFLGNVFENFNGIVDAFLTKNSVNPFLKNVVVLGVLNALSGVFSFLPQTLIIYSALCLLEESGYMSRLAYVSEKLLAKTGLNGRAVFSIFIGFGCTALSIGASGGLENVKSRKRVALISAFVPCSAKIPVISYLSSFSRAPFLFITTVYLLGVVVGLVELKIFTTVTGKEKRLPLVIELPPYRIPTLKNYVKSLLINAKGFIIRICTVIFIISLSVNLLSSVTVNLTYANGDYSKSIIYAVGNAIKFITYPIGITDGRLASSLLAGIFAKEGVLSTLITLYPNGLTLTSESLLALTFFVYAYVPCVTALGVLSAEIGKKFTLKLALLQLIVPLLASYYIYAFMVVNAVKIITVILAVLLLIIKLLRIKK